MESQICVGQFKKTLLLGSAHLLEGCPNCNFHPGLSRAECSNPAISGVFFSYWGGQSWVLGDIEDDTSIVVVKCPHLAMRPMSLMPDYLRSCHGKIIGQVFFYINKRIFLE